MEKNNLDLVKRLFNTGKLTLVAANFYESQGYEIICNDGKVSYISKSE